MAWAPPLWSLGSDVSNSVIKPHALTHVTVRHVSSVSVSNLPMRFYVGMYINLLTEDIEIDL